MRFGVTGCLLALCLSLTSCGQDEEPQRRREISAPAAPEDYIHPVASTAGRLIVPGCCSFEVQRASVEELAGDVFGRLIKGENFEIEIGFGTGLPPLPADFAAVEKRKVDGVDLAELSSQEGVPALAADVPLSAAAIRKGIRQPQLQAVARCKTKESCERARQWLASVRF